jgi:hypothetical protein
MLRFLYEGNEIADDDTPASLNMEDDGLFLFPSQVSNSLIFVDSIDAMVERMSFVNVLSKHIGRLTYGNRRDRRINN